MESMRSAVSMAKTYTSGPMFEVWRAKQAAGLWPSELAMIRTHCSDLDAVVCSIGCGAGRETFALHHLGYRNLCGVDYSETLVEAARRRCRDERLSIRFEVASADQLPFGTEFVDVITMFENIYGHITPHSARLRSLAEAARVLKPGGRIMMTVTSLYHSLLYRLYFEACELGRRFFNPAGMERGDKLLRRSQWPPGTIHKAAPRTHWFCPVEIPSDASRVGLAVIQQTTTNAVVRDPCGDSVRYRGEGRLAFVLSRPRERRLQTCLP